MSFITYTKLDEPSALETVADPTTVYGFADYSGGTTEPGDYGITFVAESVPKGTPFVAVGKAQLNNDEHTVLFMDEQSFGDANNTGVPICAQGITETDLQTVASPQPDEPSTATPPTEEQGEKVDVHVTPPDPNKWMLSYNDYPDGPRIFSVIRDVVIHDIAGIDPDVKAYKGRDIETAGKFSDREGNKFVRTVRSVREGKWYGIPEGLINDDSEIDNLSYQTIVLNQREKLIAKVAAVEGFFSRLFNAHKG